MPVCIIFVVWSTAGPTSHTMMRDKVLKDSNVESSEVQKVSMMFHALYNTSTEERVFLFQTCVSSQETIETILCYYHSRARASSRRDERSSAISSVAVAQPMILFSFIQQSPEDSKEDDRAIDKVADGCLHVFLDVGSNIGVHTRFLYEPHLYPKAKASAEIFDRAFGPPTKRDNRDICVFAFEPNPAHKKRFEMLENAYNDAGFRFKALNVAAGISNGHMTFYHQGDLECNEWGFATQKLGKDEVSTEELVPEIQFAEWVENEIYQRKLPEVVYGTYNETGGASDIGKVVMKMDIEGGEFRVLPTLLFTGIMCNTVDFLFGETHRWFRANITTPTDPTGAGKGHLVLKDQRQALGFFHNMMWALQSTTPDVCKTIWMDVDEEYYLNDEL